MNYRDVLTGSAETMEIPHESGSQLWLCVSTAPASLIEFK